MGGICQNGNEAALITGLLITLGVAGIIFGMGKLLQVLPSYTWKVQTLASAADHLVKKYSDKIVYPIIVVRGWSEGSKVLKQRILSSKRVIANENKDGK